MEPSQSPLSQRKGMSPIPNGKEEEKMDGSFVIVNTANDALSNLTPPVARKIDNEVKPGLYSWAMSTITSTFTGAAKSVVLKIVQTAPELTGRALFGSLANVLQIEKEYEQKARKIMGNEEFADLLTMIRVVQAKLDPVELIKSLKMDNEKEALDFINSNEMLIKESIFCTLQGAFVHVTTFANHNFPNNALLQDHSKPEDFFSKFFARVIDRIGIELEGLKVLEDIPDETERKEKILELFQKFSKNIVKMLFPEGLKSIKLPAVTTYVLQTYWDDIVNKTLPQLFFDFYTQSSQPNTIEEIRKKFTDLPEKKEVFDLIHGLSATVSENSWTYLQSNEVLGPDWHTLGRSIKQFFGVNFGFSKVIKSSQQIEEEQKKITVIEKQFKSFVDQVLDIHIRSEAIVNDTNYHHVPEKTQNIIKELTQSITDMKNVLDENKFKDVNSFSEKLKEKLTHLENYANMTTTTAYSLSMELNKLFITNNSQTSAPPFFKKKLNKIATIKKNHAESLEKLRDLFNRSADAKKILGETVEGLIVRIFAHFKEDYDRTYPKDPDASKPDIRPSFIGSILKQLVAVAQKTMGDMKSEELDNLKKQISDIDEKLKENKNEAEVTVSTIKKLTIDLQELQIKTTQNKSNILKTNAELKELRNEQKEESDLLNATNEKTSYAPDTSGINQKLEINKENVEATVNKIEQLTAILQKLKEEDSLNKKNNLLIPAQLAKLQKLRENQAKEESELLNARSEKITKIFAPATQEIMEYIGFETPDKLPIYKDIQKFAFNTIKDQIGAFLYDNVTDLKILDSNHDVFVERLSSLKGGRAIVAALSQSTELVEKTINNSLDNPEPLKPILDRALKSNFMTLESSTLDKLLEGLKVYRQSAQSKELRQQIKSTTESVLMWVFSRLAAGTDPTKPALEQIFSNIINKCQDSLKQIDLQKNEAIREFDELQRRLPTKDGDDQRAKLLTDAFGDVTKGLLSSMGLNSAADLPAPLVVRETAWAVLNDLLNATLYDYGKDLVPILKSKAQNETKILTHPEGANFKGLIEGLRKKIGDVTKESLQADEYKLQMVESGSFSQELVFDKNTATSLADSLQSALKSPTVDPLWTLTDFTIETFLYEIFARIMTRDPQVNIQTLFDKLFADMSLIGSIDSKKTEELNNLTATLDLSYESIRNEQDPAKRNTLIRERTDEKLNVANKTKEIYRPATQALLNTLGYSEATFPLPENAKESVLATLDDFIYQYHKQFVGTQKALGATQLAPDLNPETTKKLSQAILGLTKDYLVKNENNEQIIKDKLSPLFSDDIVNWMTGSIQKSIQTPTAPLETVNALWGGIESMLSDLLTNTFGQMIARAPQIVSGDRLVPGSPEDVFESVGDPLFMKKMTTHTLSQINTHLETIRQKGILPNKDKEIFYKEFTKELLDLLMPKGADGLPLDPAIKEMLKKSAPGQPSIMDTIEEKVRKTIKENFETVFDSKKRAKLLNENLANLHAEFYAKDQQMKVPLKPEKILEEIFDMAVKTAFESTVKTMASLPNKALGAVLGKWAVEKKEVLDTLFTTIFLTLFYAVANTILHRLTLIVLNVWHSRTAKISSEFVKLVNMQEHNALIQTLATDMVKMLKGENPKGQVIEEMDANVDKAAKELAKQIGGLNFGLISTFVGTFSGMAGTKLTETLQPFMGKNALQAVIDEGLKAMSPPEAVA